MRDRLAELTEEIAREDKKISKRATRATVLKIASWAMEYWPRRTNDRDNFFEFLRREFGLVGKACTKCHDWQPRRSFSINRRNPDGLQSWCKACVKALLEQPEVIEQRRRACRKYRQKKKAA